MTRPSLRLAGRLEVIGYVVSFDSGIERWLSIRELDTKSEHVTVVLHASEYVLDNEQGRGIAERDCR